MESANSYFDVFQEKFKRYNAQWTVRGVHNTRERRLRNENKELGPDSYRREDYSVHHKAISGMPLPVSIGWETEGPQNSQA